MQVIRNKARERARERYVDLLTKVRRDVLGESGRNPHEGNNRGATSAADRARKKMIQRHESATEKQRRRRPK